MLWLVLNHFLPARELKSLSEVIVRSASADRVQLTALFRDVMIDEPGWNDAWLLEPLPTTDPEATYLQGLVRSLAWGNDAGGWPSIQDKGKRNGTPPLVLERITSLAPADFEWPTSFGDEILAASETLQESLKCFVKAFQAAQLAAQAMTPDEFWPNVEAQIAPVSLPLRALTLKHIADLCGDLDRWDRSVGGYERTQTLLSEWEADSSWHPCKAVWHGLVLQSYAAALGVTVGPRRAAEILKTEAESRSLASDPLLLANLSLDLHVASSHPDADGLKAGDRRVYILRAPLLEQSHDGDDGTRASLRGKFNDANRKFWSTLRRQTALGAATSANATRRWYARSLVAQVAHEISTNAKTSRSFNIAVRLLIESGSADAVAGIQWTERLVDECVNAEVVQGSIESASRHGGVRRERELVTIELFREWALRIAPTQTAVANTMWKHLALLAKAFPATFEGITDVGRQSLRALKELAERRPEFRKENVLGVAEAIKQKLASEDLWWGKVAALELAFVYVDVFDDEIMGEIVRATLSVLVGVDTSRDVWPLVRPALALLVSKPAATYARGRQEVAREILAEIFRFGVEQESEQTRIFFYLHEFEDSLFREPTLRKQLEVPLAHTRKAALEINSSRVTEAIYALLLAPTVSGDDGLTDAIEGLVRILRSVDEKRPSIGLGVAYDPVILLVERQQEIEAVFSDRLTWLREKMSELGRLIAHLWELSFSRPLLLAAFSFPPKTQPDPVIAHNWAFASMRFATIAEAATIGAGLASASRNPALAGPINLARASRTAEGKSVGSAMASARSDDRDAFYTALGRRIAALALVGDAEVIENWRVLLDGCLRFGPRIMDAAVLLSAVRLNLHEHARGAGLLDYARRLTDRELRLALYPIVDCLLSEPAAS